MPIARNIDPNLLIRLQPPLRFAAPVPKTTTQLALASIKQLSEADAVTLREALATLSNAGFQANRLMSELERHVKVGEVLNELAEKWSDETIADFAQTFRMEPQKRTVMDLLVSIAILNDADLEDELVGENLPSTTDQDMMENRPVVWQYPPPGTPLEPPYLVLVAVDRQDVAKAEDVVKSIVSQLVIFDNVRLPDAAARKLR